MTRALTGGAETTIDELAILLNLPGDDPLSGVHEVVTLVEAWGLELVPPVKRGSLASPRVLRRRETSSLLTSVTNLIDAGEGPRTEFKSSLLCSMRDWERDGSLVELPQLPGEVLKTIGAFLNSEGGDLLIGVSDNGETSEGIERDLELRGWDLDKWQLHLVSLIEGRLQDGALAMPYLRIQLHDFDGAAVVHVSVMARRVRTFVKREKTRPFEFFVRNGSRTDSLDLPAFYSHLQSRGGS
jgi:predicted HTH transcriptional regulator